MRLVIARCTVDYVGRLTAHLPEAPRLLLVKADGSVSVHADDRAYKPLNWMTPPCSLAEQPILDESGEDTGELLWVVENSKGEQLRITISEVLSDSSHELGQDPGLVKDGVETHLQELLAACREYQAATGRRMTIEYVRREGVNDSLEEADRLVALLAGLRSLVNLIPWNPVDHPVFRRSSKSRVRAFQERVQLGGVRCTVRHEKGSDIEAACGQLRLREVQRLSGPSVRTRALPAVSAGG